MKAKYAGIAIAPFVAALALQAQAPTKSVWDAVYTQAQAVGTGKVLMAGVASYDDDSATVLVVHDGSVKSKLGQSQVRHQRWTVNLVKVRDRWLVDQFTPVN